MQWLFCFSDGKRNLGVPDGKSLSGDSEVAALAARRVVASGTRLNLPNPATFMKLRLRTL
jgi:hypothetical protein